VRRIILQSTALKHLKAIYTAYHDHNISPPPFRHNSDGSTVDRRATAVREYNIIITDASTKHEYEKRDFYCIDAILYSKKYNFLTKNSRSDNGFRAI